MTPIFDCLHQPVNSLLDCGLQRIIGTQNLVVESRKQSFNRPSGLVDARTAGGRSI